jgi:hypothetical protein
MPKRTRLSSSQWGCSTQENLPAVAGRRQRGDSGSEVARRKKRGGPRLGSGTPKGRVPLIRPRRDRIMGSSILASLSEAGGNDPVHPASRPLPPYLRDIADRVGTRPTHALMQLEYLFTPLFEPFPGLIYQQLMQFHFVFSHGAKPNLGTPSRFDLGPFSVFSLFAHNVPLALSTASRWLIMCRGFSEHAQVVLSASCRDSGPR